LADEKTFCLHISTIDIQLGGLIEILTQSLLLSALTIYWVEHSHLRWLNWVLSIGLLARQAHAS
jgi:hypothetical protein